MSHKEAPTKKAEARMEGKGGSIIVPRRRQNLWSKEGKEEFFGINNTQDG